MISLKFTLTRPALSCMALENDSFSFQAKIVGKNQKCLFGKFKPNIGGN